jgi:hypothetical protein
MEGDSGDRVDKLHRLPFYMFTLGRSTMGGQSGAWSTGAVDAVMVANRHARARGK